MGVHLTEYGMYIDGNFAFYPCGLIEKYYNLLNFTRTPCLNINFENLPTAGSFDGKISDYTPSLNYLEYKDSYIWFSLKSYDIEYYISDKIRLTPVLLEEYLDDIEEMYLGDIQEFKNYIVVHFKDFYRMFLEKGCPNKIIAKELDHPYYYKPDKIETEDLIYKIFIAHIINQKYIFRGVVKFKQNNLDEEILKRTISYLNSSLDKLKIDANNTGKFELSYNAEGEIIPIENTEIAVIKDTLNIEEAIKQYLQVFYYTYKQFSK